MANEWYTLDNAAKIFPAVYKRSDTNSYRLSALLKENIDPNILKKATIDALKRFPSLYVKLKRGAFWYYLEHNYNTPIIEEEDPYLFNSVHIHTHNGFMFTVSYFGRRISLEMFHALTDGTGASEFLKTIVYYYLIHTGKDIKNDGSVQTDEVEKLSAETLDDFNENYESKVKAPDKEPRAFQMKGKHYKDNWTGLVQLIADVDNLKQVAHKYDATITGLMGAVILYSLYNVYFKDKKTPKHNLRLFLPINARKYFNSHSMRNFMLYTRTTGEFRNKSLTFEDVVGYVKDTLSKVNRDLLMRQLVSNVNIEKNFLVKILPLPIKNFIMRIAYKMHGQDSNTVSFSNLGKLTIPEDMSPFIERFEFMIGVSKLSPVNMGAVSVNNTFVFSYASKFVDRDVIQQIASNMASLGIKVTVETNDLEVE